MSVVQRVRRSAVDAWIAQQLAANPTLVSIFGGRFWQMSSVLTQGDEYFDFPYVVWHGDVVRVAQRLLPANYRGYIESNYKVRGVWQYERPYDEADFDTALHELENALTGVGGDISVVVSGTTIGYIDQSRYVKDFSQNQDDGDKRIVERGIEIDVMWRGTAP